MFTLATSINQLSNQVIKLTSEMDAFQWAAGIIVTIIVAFGFGSGLTLIKISNNQVKRIEEKLSSEMDRRIVEASNDYDNKLSEFRDEVSNKLITISDDLSAGIVVCNGWKATDNKQLRFAKFHGLILVKINITLKHEADVQGMGEIIITDPVPSFDLDGDYPAFIQEEQRWITVACIKGRWLIPDAHPGTEYTLKLNQIWVNPSKADYDNK